MQIKRIIKRTAALTLALSMLLADSIFATSVGGSNGGVSVTGLAPVTNSPSIESSIVRTYPWYGYSGLNFQGYRMYCVDNQNNLVSNVVDFVYNTPRVVNAYNSIYSENMNTSNWYKMGTINYESVKPILRQNMHYGYVTIDENGNQWRDVALYVSTAWEEIGGIIEFVLNSSYATEYEIRNCLISSVYNGNSRAGSTGSSTQGTSVKTGAVTVIGNTGDAHIDDLMLRVNNALTSGSSANCYTLLDEIIGEYGIDVFNNSTVYGLSRELCTSISNGNVNTAIKEAESLYPTGLRSKSQRKSAYDVLVNKGYNRATAFVAVHKAKATSSSKIGTLIMSLAHNDNDLRQIIPTSENQMESTDTHAIDDLLASNGFKFTYDRADDAFREKKATEVMAMYNYRLVIEPVLWFRWANNQYQKASVGFKVETDTDVKTDHQDETWGWFKNGAPASATTPDASYVKDQDAVMEVTDITYKWKYKDASGTEQTIEVVHTVTEGTDYVAAGNYVDANNNSIIDPSAHKPTDEQFKYDGNTVTWTQTAPTYETNEYAKGAYHDYTNWYATCSNSKYKQDSGWTYGSLRDAIHYCTSGERTGTNSALLGLITVYYPASMIVAADLEFSNNTLHGMAEEGFTFNGTDLNWLSANSANYGYGMHVYQTSGYYTKTRDEEWAKGTQHKAPAPQDTDEYRNYLENNGEVTIVKTYREWSGNIGEGEVVTEQTFISYKEPEIVYILNEEDWTLSDWYVSSKSSQLKDESSVDNTQGKWDSMYAEVGVSKKLYPGNYSSVTGKLSNPNGMPTNDDWVDNTEIPVNDGDCQVGLDGDDPTYNTLYVLYERGSVNTGEPESADTDLTQSEIWDVTSVDKKIDVNTFPGWPATLKAADDTISVSDGLSKYMIARGDDKVTFKEFTGNIGSLINTNREKTLKGYMDAWYYGPEGGTASKQNYEHPYTLGIFNGSDVTSMDMGFTVGVYHGSKNVASGANVETNTVLYSTRINTGKISVVPYYWMTVSDLDGNKEVAYMACEGNNKRTIPTYDYAEVQLQRQGSLEVKSNMWATDRNITMDNSLKGGAVFKLTTDTKARVIGTTHSIVWDDYDKNTGSTVVAEIELTDTSEPINSTAASERHSEFIDVLCTDIQDDFNITQYVAKGVVDKPAGGNNDISAPDSSIYVVSNSDISALNNGSSTSSGDSKYYLQSGASYGNITNTALMETDVVKTDTLYTRVFSLPNGNIYYVTGSTYEACDSAMATIMESAKHNGGVYESSLVCKKGDYGTLLVTGDIKDAIIKSGALQTLLNSIELNTGNDVNAPWCQGLQGDLAKTWYNEGAWVTVMTQASTIDVGIITVDARTLVVDPKLTPQQTKKSNSGVKYNSSAFRVDWIGENTNIGEFRGVTLTGSDNDFKKMFKVSNTFYIPNRTVTDNK